MKNRARFTKEFKATAVELVTAGKPVREVARELDISKSNLHRWVQAHNQGEAQFNGVGTRAEGEGSEAVELRLLRREIADLKVENDILKKAAVILGTIPQSKFGK